MIFIISYIIILEKKVEMNIVMIKGYKFNIVLIIILVVVFGLFLVMMNEILVDCIKGVKLYLLE